MTRRVTAGVREGGQFTEEAKSEPVHVALKGDDNLRYRAVYHPAAYGEERRYHARCALEELVEDETLTAGEREAIFEEADDPEKLDFAIDALGNSIKEREAWDPADFAASLGGTLLSFRDKPLTLSGVPVLGKPGMGYTDTLDENGFLVKQVRLVDRKPDDAPDGTAAIILYQKGWTVEKFYTAGKLHDGSGDKPSERQTNAHGMLILTRGYRRPHQGWLVPQDSPDGQPAKTAFYPDGRTVVEHCIAGRRQDPPTGEPALTVVLPDGTRKVTNFPFAGRAEDLPDGTPSERHWDPDGNLVLEGRRWNSSAWDSDDGQPAIRSYRSDGTLREETYCYDGRMLDPGKERPAFTRYADDGVTVVSTESRPSLHFSIYDEDISWLNRPTRKQGWPYPGKVAERHVPAGNEAAHKQS